MSTFGHRLGERSSVDGKRLSECYKNTVHSAQLYGCDSNDIVRGTRCHRMFAGRKGLSCKCWFSIKPGQQ